MDDALLQSHCHCHEGNLDSAMRCGRNHEKIPEVCPLDGVSDAFHTARAL